MQLKYFSKVLQHSLQNKLVEFYYILISIK